MDYSAVFLNSLCSKKGKDFKIRLDYNAEGNWVITYGVLQMPREDRKTINSPAKADISAAKVGPLYSCPHCGNTSFFRCGQCGSYVCMPENSDKGYCPVCKAEKKMTGYIKEVTGTGGGSN